MYQICYFFFAFFSFLAQKRRLDSNIKSKSSNYPFIQDHQNIYEIAKILNIIESENLVIFKDLTTSTQKRKRFEIPLLVAVLRTKFPKEQILVHKTTNLWATQNSIIR